MVAAMVRCFSAPCGCPSSGRLGETRWQCATRGRISRSWLGPWPGDTRSAFSPRRGAGGRGSPPRSLRADAPLPVPDAHGRGPRHARADRRLLKRAGHQMGLPEGETAERLKADHHRGHGLFQRRASKGAASAACRRAHRLHRGPRHPRNKEGEVHVDRYSWPVRAEPGPWVGGLAKGEQTEPVVGPHEAAGMGHGLGNLGALPLPGRGPANVPISGMTDGEEGARLHGGQIRLTEALVLPRSVEGGDGLP